MMVGDFHLDIPFEPEPLLVIPEAATSRSMFSDGRSAFFQRWQMDCTRVGVLAGLLQFWLLFAELGE